MTHMLKNIIERSELLSKYLFVQSTKLSAKVSSCVTESSRRPLIVKFCVSNNFVCVYYYELIIDHIFNMLNVFKLQRTSNKMTLNIASKKQIN